MYTVKDYQISHSAKKFVKPQQCSSWQQLCFGGLFWPVLKAYVIVYFGSNLTLSHTWILFTFSDFLREIKTVNFPHMCFDEINSRFR